MSFKVRVIILLAFLAGLGACTDLGNGPPAVDFATPTANGTWDVHLASGGECKGLSALRPEDAIALCKTILSP